MMAENAGRSLKLHIQQYFIRSYLGAYVRRVGKKEVILQWQGLCNNKKNIIWTDMQILLVDSFVSGSVRNSHLLLTKVLHNSLVFSFDETSVIVEAQTKAPAQDMEERLKQNTN